MLEPPLAKALIRSLNRGTTVAAGVRWIHVGHDRWLAAQDELLGEVAEDDYSETKFVRGAYGAGKSHFLAVVQDKALEIGWVTAHVECKVDGVQIDRFETLYPQIARKLRIRDGESGETFADGTGLAHLLGRWYEKVLAGAGLRRDGLTRPFDEDSRIYDRLGRDLEGSNLPSSFEKALVAFARASLARERETKESVVSWMKGVSETVEVSKHYLRAPSPAAKPSPRELYALRPIGKGTASEALHGLLWLVVRAGYVGLVLCIDEIEELAKLGSKRRRDQALQALREHVDNAGGDAGYRRLCLYLAATPEMFEGRDYFPRYDALATRIQPVGPEINWRAPVIDLDRTPLTEPELVAMATKIRDVHRIAFGKEVTKGIDDRVLAGFVSETLRLRVRIAKPRLLARIVVAELERVRQNQGVYRPRPLDEQAVLRVVESEDNPQE